jgi:hypothetical protein
VVSAEKERTDMNDSVKSKERLGRLTSCGNIDPKKALSISLVPRDSFSSLSNLKALR